MRLTKKNARTNRVTVLASDDRDPRQGFYTPTTTDTVRFGLWTGTEWYYLDMSSTDALKLAAGLKNAAHATVTEEAAQ